ncbi:MAG: dCTP deaminase [Candidatus Hodarchaeales archaeon]|jgi:dCTP deaminase
MYKNRIKNSLERQKMILSYNQILEALQEGKIIIDRIAEDAIGPCSIDLTLSDSFTVFKTGKLFSPKDREAVKAHSELVKTEGEPFTLSPGQFVLGQTQEKIAISKDLAGTLEGRSSVARLGIVVHAAGLVNPGTGLNKPTRLTLEIFCQLNNPVQLLPGMGIMQILFHQLSSPVRTGYDERSVSHYIGLEEPVI